MKKNKLYILLISLSFIGYAWLGWNIAESSAIPSVCMFKAVTHLPCPSCGTTRALVLLLRGDMAGSFLVNPFGMILALALFIVPSWILADTLLRRDSLFRRYNSMEAAFTGSKWISVPAIGIVLANWAWNIAKGL